MSNCLLEGNRCIRQSHEVVVVLGYFKCFLKKIQRLSCHQAHPTLQWSCSEWKLSAEEFISALCFSYLPTDTSHVSTALVGHELHLLADLLPFCHPRRDAVASIAELDVSYQTSRGPLGPDDQTEEEDISISTFHISAVGQLSTFLPPCHTKRLS